MRCWCQLGDGEEQPNRPTNMANLSYIYGGQHKNGGNMILVSCRLFLLCLQNHARKCLCNIQTLKPCLETQRTETCWETLTHTGKNMTGIYCVVVMRDERAKGKEERERDPSATLYRDAW